MIGWTTHSSIHPIILCNSVRLRISQIHLFPHLIDGTDVFEIHSELTARMGLPFAILQRDLVTGIIHNLAGMESLKELTKARRDAKRNKRPKLDDIHIVAFVQYIRNIGSPVVLSQPDIQQLHE